MPKKMDPNVKLVNEISKAIGAVDAGVDRDPGGLAISKGARSALNRIKSLAEAIKVPSDGDADRIAHERKLALAALAAKAKATKARKKNTKAAAERSGKRAKAKAAKRAKPTKTKAKGGTRSRRRRRRRSRTARTTRPRFTERRRRGWSPAGFDSRRAVR